MDKKEIREFFDCLASSWDDALVRKEEVICRILDNAGIHADSRILDVACGTGVLISDYLARGAAGVTGIDISEEMIRIAKEKFPEENVKFICADAETERLEETYDSVMVYNALPHFPDPELLIRNLASCLRQGGTLSVAHGMSREKIDSHHSGSACRVSSGLMSAEELAALMARAGLAVTCVISDTEMYQVCAVRQ